MRRARLKPIAVRAFRFKNQCSCPSVSFKVRTKLGKGRKTLYRLHSQITGSQRAHYFKMTLYRRRCGVMTTNRPIRHYFYVMCPLGWLFVNELKLPLSDYMLVNILCLPSTEKNQQNSLWYTSLKCDGCKQNKRLYFIPKRYKNEEETIRITYLGEAGRVVG